MIKRSAQNILIMCAFDFRQCFYQDNGVFMSGQLIKEAREKIGMTQKELAQLLKISTTYISKVEKNIQRPSKALAEEISKKLSIDLSDLTKDYNIAKTGLKACCPNCGTVMIKFGKNATNKQQYRCKNKQCQHITVYPVFQEMPEETRGLKKIYYIPHRQSEFLENKNFQEFLEQLIDAQVARTTRTR